MSTVLRAAIVRKGLPLFILSLTMTTVGPLRLQAEQHEGFQVIAYYHGRSAEMEDYNLDQLTHICYSFLHLKGGRLATTRPHDSASIAYLASLKRQHPHLKVILSFGGWGGCETCSEVFSTPEGRREFALSAKSLIQKFGVDGIDLDWEYPAVESVPGHPFSPADRHNFTLLVQELRAELGDRYELSFAAGASREHLNTSFEWNEVMPIVDRVHLMTYDFVHGNSPVTGHHTPLSTSPGQLESAESVVRYCDSLGVPRNKIVIGAAFYARVWENVPDTNRGLFQAGKFKEYVTYRNFQKQFDPTKGFVTYWDSTAQAPYIFNAREGIFATFDDVRSVTLKTQYAIREKLAGIMFWELTGDTPGGGLLEAIDRTKKALLPARETEQ